MQEQGCIRNHEDWRKLETLLTLRREGLQKQLVTSDPSDAVGIAAKQSEIRTISWIIAKAYDLPNIELLDAEIG